MKRLSLGLLLFTSACDRETIHHASPLGDSTCGGTWGLCSVECSDELDCAEFSDFAVCGKEGRCETTVGCLSAEVCGPAARCSTRRGGCAPRGPKDNGDSCANAAECRSGACDDICLEPCSANRDCAPAERCVPVPFQHAEPRGHCQLSPACEDCAGTLEFCDPLGSTCTSTCRIAADCDGGDCVASEDGPWTCAEGSAKCPADAFVLLQVCFVHDACESDSDCSTGSACVPPTPSFAGGYCSPGESG